MNELLDAVMADVPLGSGDAKRIVEWRGRLCALRHALPDDARGAQIVDALLDLAALLATWGDRTRTEIEIAVQDHVWRFARLKANSTAEAVPVAEEIRKRVGAIPDGRSLREFIAALAGMELRLLKDAES